MGGVQCTCDNRMTAGETLGAEDEDQPFVDVMHLDVRLIKRFRFEVKPETNLGTGFASVQTPVVGSVLVVSSMEDDSVLAVTNEGQPGLRRGDVVLKLDGKAGDSGFLLRRFRQLKSGGGKVEVCVLTRPEVFDVALTRHDAEKLGIAVAAAKAAKEQLKIKQVFNDSAVHRWNKAQWMTQILVHDVVVSIDGEEKPAPTMIGDMQACWKNNDAVRMGIRTPPREIQPQF
eukprot:TRINITY_DN5409_c0_g1_i2.p1 TRINITY_DN5409_c0_g1~~TRINITY_DN5409_c0_g1_i2.p1  ORF type:complete len:230 (-),score=44.63 TRINITY_DN5409_c0_g1_i2:241-930(-)